MHRAVQWSPYAENEFLVTNPGLRLYSIDEKKIGRVELSLSESGDNGSKGPVSVVGSNTDESVLNHTGISWFPDATAYHKVAVAQPNGTVRICGVLQDRAPADFYSKDLVPHHGRACTSLQWNPLHKQKLAVGLERHGRESSLLVWDVNTTVVNQALNRRKQESWRVSSGTRLKEQRSAATTTGPKELVATEGVLSLAWVPGDGNLLFAGCGSRMLSLFDIRTNGTARASTGKAHGASNIAVDPFNTDIVVSYSKSESQLKFFDSRLMADPLFVQDLKNVVKLAWCPTRPGLLGALCKHSHVVQLFDTHLTHSRKFDEVAGNFISRAVTKPQETPRHDYICDFSWHPSCVNRILTVSQAGAIEDLTVSERMPTSFSPRGEFVIAKHSELLLKEPQQVGAEDKPVDTGAIMRTRAIDGYRLDAAKNAEIVADDPEVQGVWNWLLAQVDRPYSQGLIGVMGLLAMDTKAMKVPPAKHHASMSVRMDQTVIFPVYDTTPQRKAATQTCGWAVLSDSAELNRLLDRLEANGEYERAAALALFHHNLRRAIRCLTAGADEVEDDAAKNVFVATAMALSGYSSSSDMSLWKETCSSLRTRLESPYLRAALGFLTCQDQYYQDVLDEEGVKLADRVSFACRFLQDDDLGDYLDQLSKEVIPTGRLEAVVLTGLTQPESLELFSHYVDRTSDVQTVTLLCAVATGHLSGPALRRMQNEERVKEWLESYRDLLDIWQLWTLRSKFDVARLSLVTTKQVPQQVFMRCNFCDKSVAGAAAMRGMYQRGKANAHACPTCRKPLPRCSVCLIRMGTVPQKSSDKAMVSKANQMDNWVTWCQDCRHGGHASHLESWFAQHDECPVAGCPCMCNSGNQFLVR